MSTPVATAEAGAVVAADAGPVPGPVVAADAGPVPGPGVPTVARHWPVGTRPPVLRGWEPPATPYGPGHRGVDLAAVAGAPVRAVAAGRVSFAGRVAGRGVVSLELTGTGDPPLRTTYEPVEVSVRKGDEVAAGEVLGTVEPTGSHCAACLHWGLLRGDVYLNPLSVLPPWLLAGGPSRLLPVLGVPLPAASTGDRAGALTAGDTSVSGRDPRASPDRAISPARPATPWRPPPP
ncbi:M23 family metallopeptidase [Streptomyces sp. DH41]|nr:M23 family metallopeptidase [Streptomyces sp. DH41]MDG9724059.1 M23 family metallopeptidase [Streptomyces sp. DH41]